MLTEFEKSEIAEYPIVYYLNLTPRPNIEQRSMKEAFNNGFDTKDGEYICSTGDHIAYRFEI